MKIRNRLTLLFTLLFAALLLLFAVLIYLLSAQNRKEDYYNRLKQQAIIKTNLLLDAAVPPSVLQTIYKSSQNSLLEEEVAIYDTAFHLLYHDAVEIDKVKETEAMIAEIVAEGEIEFEQDDVQMIGLLYHHNGKDYVLTAAAKDVYGLYKLHDLKRTLVICYLAAIFFTLVAGRIFAGRALQPVAAMVDRVEDITAKNLDLRIPVKNERDEIGELASTFNKMLNRLEQSFDAQKQFVSNISHELRTPLTSMISELELSLHKEREQGEYKETIRQALADARQLVKLSNGLLDFAKASYDQSEIARKGLRMDELIMEARETVLKANPAYKVDIIFEQEIEEEKMITVRGNEYLLKVALINLIENGCKFSPDKQSTIYISFPSPFIVISVVDKGPGISEHDLPHLGTPFYRGNNSRKVQGHGIGFALAQKIVQLHHGTVAVLSVPGEGTTVTVRLPHS
jgi:signal transduction histidine kinase